jgi:hypothetical protein
MTEAEWLASDDPRDVLAHRGGHASDRKRRLLACAWSRRVWHLLGEGGRHALEVAERYAEGEAGDEELESALRVTEEEKQAFDNKDSRPRYLASYAAYWSVAPRFGEDLLACNASRPAVDAQDGTLDRDQELS